MKPSKVRLIIFAVLLIAYAVASAMSSGTYKLAMKQIQEDALSSPESAEIESAYKEFIKQKLTPINDKLTVRLDPEKLQRTTTLYQIIRGILLAVWFYVCACIIDSINSSFAKRA